MCGIAGYVDFNSNTDPSIVKKMTDSIAYRGPDSSGKFISKNNVAGLGIRRLSIIDLKTGDQPIKNEDGSVTVVYNGEIYNYKKLKAELLKHGHKFKTKTDTEVLVHGYEQWGEAVSEKLNGMFAYALWDDTKQKLILGRDRAGIKPLYFYRSGRKIVFGSEVKTILTHPGYPKAINADSLSLYLYFGYNPSANSMFTGIKKLLPGHTLSFSKSGLQIKKYFEVNMSHDDLDFDDSLEGLDKLLENAVVGQLMADVPVGVFLSGGLDSSLICYYISRVAKLKSFSIGFDDTQLDESSYAYAVAKKLGTKHYSEKFTANDVLDIFPTIIKNLDEPLADASLLPTYKVSKLARKYVTVALSGDGGDELFGGYPQYQGHILANYLGFLPQPALELSKHIVKLLPNPYKWKAYDKNEVYSNFISGVKLDPVKRHLVWMKNFYRGSDIISGKPNLDILTAHLPKVTTVNDVTRIAQLVDFYTYLRDDYLVKSDRASMYNSLEVRVPYLDNAVVNFAFATKLTHVNLVRTKILLRDLFKQKLPDLPEIAERPKKGFGIPINNWLRGELKDFTYQYLVNQKLYEFVPKSKIEQLWKDHQKGNNNSGNLWTLIMLSGWLTNFA